MNLETAMEITADDADDADSRICERHPRSTEFAQWVGVTSAASASQSALIREIRCASTANQTNELKRVHHAN